MNSENHIRLVGYPQDIRAFASTLAFEPAPGAVYPDFDLGLHGPLRFS
jgi:hypothetical protein